MPAEFDAYVRRATWVHALDPRVKLAFVVVACTMTFLWPSFRVSAAVSALCLLLLACAQVGRPRVGRFLAGLAPLLAFVFVLTALFGGGAGPAWLSLGPLRVTLAAVQRGGVLAGRLLALGLIFFLWLSTTDQRAMVSGFTSLGLPYSWGLTLALALRYLPILGGLFQQVSEAQQARGLDLAQRGLWARLQAYRPVLVAVVIGALRHGERLGWALEARALAAPGVRRTQHRPLQLTRRDWMALAVLAAVLAAGVGMRIVW